MPDLHPARLATLHARATAAYVRHATRPAVHGAWDEHLRTWQLAYEARAAFNDGNPVFSGMLLPSEATQTAGTVTGLPLLPTGVRWELDAPKAGMLTITADVAAAQGVTATVIRPDKSEHQVVSTVAATRTTLIASAPVDGIYTVTLKAMGGPLATLLIPVQRTVFRRFREDSRALGYAFRATLPPPPTPAMRLRLALSIGAESAAHTGNAPLADKLRLDAERLPPPETTTALFPFLR
ncbi:hypothetical protein [Hymenobacter glacieicola]|uniref:Uncharacterized protein n=1 Tax=Hymenobacter glacieicola TaxID=1562124 RepID=A0ABQ1X724_9BACT|nr:hypothetical protein [Hymenobacter glacieicola]GGG60600.1 hypothetical protein GCM10011378_40770 [Hymenobacter glacieicola]